MLNFSKRRRAQKKAAVIRAKLTPMQFETLLWIKDHGPVVARNRLIDGSPRYMMQNEAGQVWIVPCGLYSELVALEVLLPKSAALTVLGDLVVEL